VSDQRFQKVMHLWGWLPQFRRVAEQESIHRAATILDLSPSALSRTVKLLEEAVGAPLFIRESGRLTLTSLGLELLEATRDAMRAIDDCVDLDREHHNSRRATVIAVSSPLAEGVVAAAIAGWLESEDSTARLDVRRASALEVEAALLRGEIDLSIGEPAGDESLLSEALGDFSAGVYSALSHALASEKDDCALESVRGHRFVTRESDDPWSAELGAEVIAKTTSFEVAERLCLGGHALSVFPDAYVAGSPLAEKLVRLTAAGLARRLFAVRRRPLNAKQQATVEALIDRVCAQRLS
jgi:DNA-binding transcriptional LysR family regulator